MDFNLVLVYGVKRDFLFNILKYFYVVEGFVLDIMYDVLEGVILKVIK